MTEGASRPHVQSLERVRSAFLLQLTQLPSRDLHDVLAYLASPKAVDQANGIGMRGVVLDGLHVTAQVVPGMSVQVARGMGAVPVAGASTPVGTPQETSDTSQMQLVNKRIITSSQAISAAGAGTRYDLIEIEPSVNTDVSQVVDFWDAGTKRFVPTGSPQAIVQHGEGTICYTAGSLGGTIPAPTAGRIPLAAVRVVTGQTSVTQADIFDLRPLLTDVLAGRGEHPTTIDVGEIVIDTPPTGVIVTTPQLSSFHVDAVVGGRRASIATAAPLDLRYAGNMPVFFDRATYANIVGGSAPSWLYVYMVAEDDQGYRMSRSAVADALGATTFSHAGWLLLSHVPPSLSNGSLAPSAPLSMPALLGNGACTPGYGKAVCVACAWFGGGTNTFFASGLRMAHGKGEFMYARPTLDGVSWNMVTNEPSAATTTSACRGDFGSNTGPAGALALDLLMLITTYGGSTEPGPYRWELSAYEARAGVKQPVPLFHMETVKGSSMLGSTIETDILLRDFPVARIPDLRGINFGGIQLEITAHYGSSSRGEGFFYTVTQFEAPTAGSGAHPEANILGYRWPTGPVVA